MKFAEAPTKPFRHRLWGVVGLLIFVGWMSGLLFSVVALNIWAWRWILEGLWR